MAAKN